MSISSSDLRDHLNQKRGKELPQVDPKVERLRKEVKNLRKSQELTNKWVNLRDEFCEAGQDLPLQSFLGDPKPWRPSKTKLIDSRTILSHKSPVRMPTNPT